MANHNQVRQLNVQLPLMTYPLMVGSHLLAEKSLLNRYVIGNQVLIVTNQTIAPYYLETVRQAFSHIQCDVLILKDGEQYKNQSSLSAIYDALIKNGHHRDTTLIALGGGVVGDLVGFAASTYQRGVGFIQIPTSLLAQVDASVGGKTAINYGDAKNMIGSFYQPQAVLIDVETLKTLPAREFNAGFAEIIKYALLVGGNFLDDLRRTLSNMARKDSAMCLVDLILQCCRIKANFVEADEREQGSRVLLNLGHTFAHALEAITNYDRWLHGEAVGIGLYCAVLLSCQLGRLQQDALTVVDGLLEAAHLPRRIPDTIDLVRLQALMGNDKKIKNNQLRFVLMRAFGDCYLDSTVTEKCLSQVLLRAVDHQLN